MRPFSVFIVVDVVLVEVTYELRTNTTPPPPPPLLSPFNPCLGCEAPALIVYLEGLQKHQTRPASVIVLNKSSVEIKNKIN